MSRGCGERRRLRQRRSGRYDWPGVARLPRYVRLDEYMVERLQSEPLLLVIGEVESDSVFQNIQNYVAADAGFWLSGIPSRCWLDGKADLGRFNSVPENQKTCRGFLQPSDIHTLNSPSVPPHTLRTQLPARLTPNESESAESTVVQARTILRLLCGYGAGTEFASLRTQHASHVHVRSAVQEGRR